MSRDCRACGHRPDGHNLDVSPLTVAQHYGDFLDGYVLDEANTLLALRFYVPVRLTDLLMIDLAMRELLARFTLDFADTIGGGHF
jgi:hypothetical protein